MKFNVFPLFLACLFSGCLWGQDLSGIRDLKRLWKYEEAAERLSEMIETSGPQVSLSEELADCYYQLGRTSAALAIYTQLSEQKPDNLFYRIRLMGLLFQEKKNQDVIRVGKEILQQDSIIRVMALLGDAFNRTEERDSAERYYRLALRRHPQDETLLNKLSAILLDRNQFDEVISMTETFLTRDPDNLTILPVNGVAHFSQKNYQQAESAFRKMNLLGDDSYSVHFYLAQCAQGIGLLADAEREFLLAWQRDSTNIGVALTIGQLQSNRMVPGWDRWFDKALEMLQLDPETIVLTATAHQNYGLAAYKLRQFDKAITQYKKMLEYDPRHYAAYYMIAQSYEYKKDYKQALAWYKKAQGAFQAGSRGRIIADEGAERMNQELFMAQTE